GELSVPRWPGVCEAFVRHAPEKESVARVGLVDLEVVSFLTSVDLEAPAAVLVVLGATRVFDDAVHRDELRYHDPSHGYLRVGNQSRNASIIEPTSPRACRTWSTSRRKPARLQFARPRGTSSRSARRGPRT